MKAAEKEGGTTILPQENNIPDNNGDAKSLFL